MKSIHEEKQFHVRIEEHVRGRDAIVVGEQEIDDPFITTEIVLGKTVRERLQAAWKAWCGTALRIRVSGTPAAHRAVFTADYTMPKNEHVVAFSNPLPLAHP